MTRRERVLACIFPAGLALVALASAVFVLWYAPSALWTTTRDLRDFVEIVLSMSQPPYYDPLVHPSGLPYGYPYFSLGFLLSLPFSGGGGPSPKVVEATLVVLSTVFSILAYREFLTLTRTFVRRIGAGTVLLAAFLLVRGLETDIVGPHPDSMALFLLLLAFRLLLVPEQAPSRRRLVAVGLSVALAALAKTYHAMALVPLWLIAAHRLAGAAPSRAALRKARLHVAGIFFLSGVAATVVTCPSLFFALPDLLRALFWETRIAEPGSRGFGLHLLVFALSYVVALPLAVLAARQVVGRRGKAPRRLLGDPFESLVVGLYPACYMLVLFLLTLRRDFTATTYAVSALFIAAFVLRVAHARRRESDEPP